MNQKIQPHPVITDYEASLDGIVRHSRMKKPVGFVNNQGYLMFNTGGKKYLCNRIAYECYNGLIKDGLVIGHFDSNPQKQFE